MYIHELKDWPHFQWDQIKLSETLINTRHNQGRLIGAMETLGFPKREEAILQVLTQDVVKSSEIEGEILDQTLVRSSVARHLGIEKQSLHPIDRNIEGVVAMMLDATQNYHQPLTKKRLLNWHALLFPTGYSGQTKIRVGAWRTGIVRVVSNRMDKEIIHFEAPPAERVNDEMEQFLNWFNNETSLDPVLKAGVAHLWFVTIHPFDDGNGRIGRALADMLLARSENSSSRYYSLSAQIQLERKGYYTILEQTQKSNLEITPWIEWFFGCLDRAIKHASSTLENILKKAHIWKAIEGIPLNERQRKMINCLLDGFIGKLTTSKWAKMTKCSQDTAYRDILDLIDRGILSKNPDGGRSSSYSIAVLYKQHPV